MIDFESRYRKMKEREDRVSKQSGHVETINRDINPNDHPAVFYTSKLIKFLENLNDESSVF